MVHSAVRIPAPLQCFAPASPQLYPLFHLTALITSFPNLWFFSPFGTQFIRVMCYHGQEKHQRTNFFGNIAFIYKIQYKKQTQDLSQIRWKRFQHPTPPLNICTVTWMQTCTSDRTDFIHGRFVNLWFISFNPEWCIGPHCTSLPIPNKEKEQCLNC